MTKLSLPYRLPESTCRECGMSVPEGSKVYPDKAARREIASIEVYCPHRERGCDWTGRLSTAEEHAVQCRHKGVKCGNEGCGVVTSAAQLDQHLRECLFRQIECEYCQSTLPFCNLDVSCKKDWIP